MLGILFLLIFNQNILWNLKDALVITSTGSGVEVIPFIKGWAILPSTILFTIIYTRLSKYFTQERVFYLMTSVFLAFFGIFAFLIYPHFNELHPYKSALSLENILPSGFKGFISMYRHWTFTCFYVMCELWNTMIITVLFWGFANRVTRLSEAPRFYSALIVISNAAIFIAGLSATAASKISLLNDWLPSSNNSWEHLIKFLMILVILSGLLAMHLFRRLHQNALKNTKSDIECEGSTKSGKKKKLTLRESLSYVCKSRYLTCLAIIVVAYNLCINLIEFIWKDQVLNVYHTISEYNSYIGNLQVIQGGLGIILSLTLVKLIKRLDWARTALVTPIVMLVTCAFFFGALFFQKHLAPFFSILGANPLISIIAFGAIQVSMSKACKNSIFDSTKEMAYIPLSSEGQIKGKAAIDGLGARFGKAGSSFICQGLLILFSSISACLPYIGSILIFTFGCWIIAVVRHPLRMETIKK